MLHITIISVGKLKEHYWKQAEQEYLKRLSVFAKIEIKEVKEEAFTDKDNTEMVKQKEAEKIKNALPKDTHVIVLDKEGKQFSSDELSKQLEQLQQLEHQNHITIVIGGPLGLHASILNLTKQHVSLSKMTFTHQMTRIILLEQLYRAFMIQENRKYHY